MHAYISDSRGRFSGYVASPHGWLFDRSLNAAAAEREARAILSETEPAQPDYRHLGPGYWSLFEISEFYPNSSPMREAGEALTAQLTAFVNS